jgi:hypothetical protein
MSSEIIYAIHWHQKQRNAHQADDLIWALEGYREAACLFVQIAEDHGVMPAEHGCYTHDEVERLKELNVGPFVLRLLRSDEWHVSEVQDTYEPDDDGQLRFVLDNRLAPNVEDRSVRLVELRYAGEKD